MVVSCVYERRASAKTSVCSEEFGILFGFCLLNLPRSRSSSPRRELSVWDQRCKTRVMDPRMQANKVAYANINYDSEIWDTSMLSGYR